MKLNTKIIILVTAALVITAVSSGVVSTWKTQQSGNETIAQIERLSKKIGGFGCFLMLAHNWANWENTRKSYELFARHVKPAINKANTARQESLQWATENSAEFIGAAMAAAVKTIEKHQAEEARKSGSKGGQAAD